MDNILKICFKAGSKCCRKNAILTDATINGGFAVYVSVIKNNHNFSNKAETVKKNSQKTRGVFSGLVRLVFPRFVIDLKTSHGHAT